MIRDSPCPRCHGKGYMPHADAAGMLFGDECELCDGSGNVPPFKAAAYYLLHPDDRDTDPAPPPSER